MEKRNTYQTVIMPNTKIASNFGEPWDGTYTFQYTDHWSNGDYWIYRSSLYWFISDSEYLYEEPHIKARKPYVVTSDPTGEYEGVDGNPNGVVKNP